MRKILRSPIWLALLIALAGWATNLCEPAPHVYWNMLYKSWHHPAPQSIVVVNLADIASLGAAGEARLIDLARSSNPRKLYIDTKLQFGLDKTDDAQLRGALSRLGSNAVFVVRPSDYTIDSNANGIMQIGEIRSIRATNGGSQTSSLLMASYW